LKKLLVPVIASILILAIFGMQDAIGHGSIDQNTGSCSPLCNGVHSVNTVFQIVGQEFIPTVSNLIGADLYVSDSSSPGSAFVTVRIRDGGPFGLILASTSKTVTNTGTPFPNEKIEHFDFPSPVPLTPGNTYVLQATSPDNEMFWTFDELATGGFYPDGRAILSGFFLEERDFAFTTYFEDSGVTVGGTIIPIDTTALLVVGAQMNAAWMIPVIVSGIGIAIVIARKF